ncbi:MAG TPA: DUF3090 domain-containing protein [Actinomycetota bacterium]
MVELDPVDRITVGAVGEPGERTFFIQARRGDRLVTILVEKQQVQLLSATVVEVLSGLGRPVEAEDLAAGSMDLEQPLDPEWRAGRLAVGYEEDRGLILLEAEELVPGDEDDEEEKISLGEQARLWATPEQMIALARHGAAVCAAGRPQCRFCGNPIEAEGHVCPAMNGHQEA